jgi:hypothetical protein
VFSLEEKLTKRKNIMKINITRSETIPTAPYSPVKIETNIEFETTDEKFNEDYILNSKRLDVLMANEIKKVLSEHKVILKYGYEKYLEELEKVDFEEELNEM